MPFGKHHRAARDRQWRGVVRFLHLRARLAKASWIQLVAGSAFMGECVYQPAH